MTRGKKKTRLFDIFKKKPESEATFKPGVKVAVSNNHTVQGHMESLDKLVDGNLPWGWCARNQDYIHEKEKPLREYAQSSRIGSIDSRIRTLEEMITYYTDMKQEFYNKGECFQKYFCDMWEHCHNSRCDNFDYITPYKETLTELLRNYETEKCIEERRSYTLPNLDANLWGFLLSHEGILQKDIYDHFDASVKSDIQSLLYTWEKTKKIEREKSGRTYKITIAK